MYLADANTSVPPHTKFRWKSIDGSKSKCKLIQNLDEKSDQARPANNLDLIKNDYDAFSDCGNTLMLCPTNNSSDDGLIKSDYDAFSDCGNTSMLCPTNNSSDDGLIKSDYDAFCDCENTSILCPTNSSSDDDLIKYDYDAFCDCGNTSILCPTYNSSDDESFINESINYSSSSTMVSYICVMQSRLITNKHHLVHRFLTLLWKLLLSLPVFPFCNKVQNSLFCPVSWS